MHPDTIKLLKEIALMWEITPGNWRDRKWWDEWDAKRQEALVQIHGYLPTWDKQP